MAITKLNNVLVKHGKIMFGIITAIIIVAFVWFFTPGADGSILFGNNPNSPKAVCGETVGQPIKNQDINDVIKAHALFNAGMANTKPDQNRVNIQFEQAFPYAAMSKAGEKLGFVVSNDAVAKIIRTQFPAFQKDGKFDKEAYKEYEKTMLIPNGYNLKDFENALRLILSVELLPAALDNGVISPAELAEYIKNDLEASEAVKIVFSIEDFKKAVKPAEKDLKAFYEANKALFMSPVKFKAETVMFRYNDYKIDEKGAKAYYEKNKAALIGQDGKQMTFEQFKPMYIKAEQQKLALKDAKAFREKVYKATENIAGNKEAYLLEYQKLAAKIQSKRLAIKWFSAADTQLAGLGAETELLATLVKKAGESSPVTDPVVGEKAVYVAAVTGTMPEAQLPYAAAKADVQKKYIDRTAVANVNEAMKNFRAAVADAKKKNVKLDINKIKALAKGAKVEAVKPVKIASFKKSVADFRKQMEAVDQMNIPENQKQMNKFGLQMQVQNLLRQLQDFYPVLETKVSELSKDQVSPEGTFAFFVTKRTQATPAEIESYKAVLADFLKDEKMQMVTAAVYEWLGKNTKNYVLLQQQAQQNEQAPAQK